MSQFHSPIIEETRIPLRFGLYRLTFRALDRVVLPRFPGSAWRGLFGHALRKNHCMTGLASCKGCDLTDHCLYHYIFETAPPPDTKVMRRYNHVPHPFLFKASLQKQPRAFTPGASVSVDLLLIGHVNQQVLHLLNVFREMGRMGRNVSDGRMPFESLTQKHLGGDTVLYGSGRLLPPKPAVIMPAPPMPERIRIVLETPLRLVEQNRLVGPRNFAFHQLFRNLLRRTSMLSYFHGDGGLDIDFAGLSQASRNIQPLETRLKIFRWYRYSSRRQTRLDMSGLLGFVELTTEGLAPFWPFLAMGAHIHAGKGTVMGLGRYRIEEI